MSLYDRVSDLSLAVRDWTLDRHERDTSSGFTRVSTVVELHGEGSLGRGEDVTYDTPDHDRLRDAVDDGSFDPIPTGEFTFGAFSTALDDHDLFPESPEAERSRHYRRWAVESAALDLALRQADTDLASALDREYDPVRFAVSTRLGEAGAERLEDLLAVTPDLDFKLDPTPEWTRALVDAVADIAGDRVRVLDFKAGYEGTSVDGSADPDLYRRVLSAFPNTVVEDAALTDETRPVLGDERDRLSWDYGITGVESVRDRPFGPSWLNIKPSRFGTITSLFETLEYCAEHDITLYGGGQFELGVGREQIQALAALFYPEGPNDVAPGGYNDPDPAPGLPASPLDPPTDPVGFSFS